MATDRRSGILLHPTSLPGSWGIGDLGPSALDFLDWLQAAGQTLWQVLPLGSLGFGNSPYSASSAFAGNPLLISPQRLAEADLLPAGALDVHPDFEADRVDYSTVGEWKEALLRIAWRHAKSAEVHRDLVDEARALGETEGYRSWLPDWALYAALKRRFEARDWLSWPATYRMRERPTLEVARRELEDELHFHYFVQLLWSRQWSVVRTAAADRGIRILGDMPIYVALDSADVWAHRELFDLDPEGRPNALAGVPPDAFSSEGQNWGVPLFRWDRAREDGYRWWIDRLRGALALTDLVRLDHFRGFAAGWRIAVDAHSARDGEWTPGPGAQLFEAAKSALGELPVVAEDLGEITDDVRDLLRELEIPCTRVLQFAFDDPASEHLPHNLERLTYLYSATHDNPTTASWIDELAPEARARLATYVDGSGDDLVWSLLRAAATSVAQITVFPLQDVLGLGDRGRMNRPSTPEGNWEWRLSRLPDPETTARLRRLTEASGRLPAAGDGEPIAHE